MNKQLPLTILAFVLSMTQFSQLHAQALGQLEALAGQSASSVAVPEVGDFVCEYNCGTSSSSSSGSYSSAPVLSPSAAFATGVASGFLEGFMISMMSGPSPADIERQRQIALEVERRRIEAQRQIEEQNKAVQAQLISSLAPIGGQLPSMNTSIGATGIGNNGAISGDALMSTLASLDGSQIADDRNRIFDTGVPPAQSAVDLRLVDIDTAVPIIPDVSDPIIPRSRLPEELLVDPRYKQAIERITLDEELMAEARELLSDLDNQMYQGEIEDVEQWRRMRADKLQDIANLENIVARQEGVLQDLAREYEIDPTLIYEERAEVAYLSSGFPADRTQLAFDIPNTSTTSDLDARLTPEFSQLRSEERLVLLNDSKFVELQDSVTTLSFFRDELNRSYELAERSYLESSLSPSQWQDFLNNYQPASNEINASIKLNNEELEDLYREYDFIRPTNGDIFH